MPQRFEEPSVRASIELDLELLGHYDELLHKLELYLERNAKVDDAQRFYRLQSIPGVGRILAMTLLYEIHQINRFPTVGQFLSYCRLVRGSHTSAGKTYGSPGKKIGNAHLKWAFSEAVPLLKRCCADAKAFADRIEKKHGPARANSYLAVKLGRAVYYMLKRGEAFELHLTYPAKRRRALRRRNPPRDSWSGREEKSRLNNPTQPKREKEHGRQPYG